MPTAPPRTRTAPIPPAPAPDRPRCRGRALARRVRVPAAHRATRRRVLRADSGEDQVQRTRTQQRESCTQGLHPQVRQFRIQQHAVVRIPLHAAETGFVGVQRGLPEGCGRRRLRPPRHRHQQPPHRRCRAHNRQTGAARPANASSQLKPMSKRRAAHVVLRDLGHFALRGDSASYSTVRSLPRTRAQSNQ